MITLSSNWTWAIWANLLFGLSPIDDDCAILLGFRFVHIYDISLIDEMRENFRIFCSWSREIYELRDNERCER